MQTYDYARAALWDTAIKFSLHSRAMTSPDHLEEVSGTYATPLLDTDELKTALRALKVSVDFEQRAPGFQNMMVEHLSHKFMTNW